ncbi:group 1 glycosyl transferase [Clostridium bornimense]|uniref:Group 1 glycosyl transferase n=1 Tax=Clostridium bornimense TaxID=1216932 RepID=W6SHP0_9CLOT|nr:glycosyltransferase [Clostridium bornimense]CDM69230.1 group 1 glycosyl transferase [Clostridium bornimense]
MRILHYSLGLPPYRTGGLTKYSYDLMLEQTNQGDQVYLLFPGEIKMIDNEPKIRYYSRHKNINVYEIINPLSVPLMKGTKDLDMFMKKSNKEVFVKFLQNTKIEIVHIHTIMGLFVEFLEACKELNLKIVYTTHDYFGLCTKVSFIDYNGKLCERRELDKCRICNAHGSSTKVIKILQSPLYRFAKNKGIITFFNRKLSLIKSHEKNTEIDDTNNIYKLNDEKYKRLIEYYNSIFSLVDWFLFNSSVAREIYKSYIECNGEVVTITHSDIKDNRKKRNYSGKKLKLTYLGPCKEYKGFYLLEDVMKELEKELYSDIELNVYGDEKRSWNEVKNININGKYEYKDLKYIFDNTDILLVPSIWNETFGFVTLEALSYGIPVIVTNKVGSKDLLGKSATSKGIIVSPLRDELKDTIINVFKDRNILRNMNNNILKDEFTWSIESHCLRIKNIYENIIGDKI